jgi:cytochrome P450
LRSFARFELGDAVLQLVLTQKLYEKFPASDEGELTKARAFAVNGDIDAVRGCAWEAVRFNPHHPLQVRFCTRDALVAQGQKRAKTILGGSNTYVGTLSGMFDPDVFTSPADFNIRRTTEYLHFGYGMHACFGKAINSVEIPELLAALLRLQARRLAEETAAMPTIDEVVDAMVGMT